MPGDWETLQEEQTIRAHALASERSLAMAPDPTPPPLAQLCCARAFGHVGEYVRVMCTLAHSILVAPSVETITPFWHLHPLIAVDLFPFVDDFHLKTNLVLDREAFISMLPCSPRLSFDSPLGMVYELLRDCFVPNNFDSGFDYYFLKYVGTLFMVIFFH
jgi:hypothetical protein